MKTLTVHLKEDKYDWLMSQIKNQHFIDASDAFEKGLDYFREKDQTIILSKNILRENIYLALQQCEKNEFTYQNIAHILKGKKLSVVEDNENREYRLTELAFQDIHEILIYKIKKDGQHIASEYIKKIESHIKGLSKIATHMSLSRFLAGDDRVDTDNLYYSRNKEYYIIFKRSDDNIIDVLTLHQTSINFEERIKRRMSLCRND